MPRPLTPHRAGLCRRYFYPALLGLALLALCVPGLHQPHAHAATTFTVNTTGDSADTNLADNVCNDGGGNCSLRAAIQQANATAGTDTININVNGTINLTGVLPDITTNMSISGPGSGLLTVRRDTGGNYRIFLVNSLGVSISGLTVTNGRPPDGAPTTNGNPFGQDGESGGGIYNAGTLTLSDVVVTGNSTGNGGVNSANFGGWGGYGGGIFNGGVLTLTNVTVSNNTTGNGATGNFGGTGGPGGGIYSGVGSGALTLTNVSVSNNTTGNGANGVSTGASGGGGGDGGGIFINNGSLPLTNVNVSGNATGDAGNGGSGGNGGGIFTNSGVQATLVGVVVSNNSAGDGGGGPAGSGGRGGGIFNNGTMTVNRGGVSGNSTGVAGSTGGFSGGSGGGVFNNASLTMLNSEVSGNNARGSGPGGGGIYNGGNLLSLTNSTISNNQANPVNDTSGGRGGGIYNSGTSATLTNVTITGNAAYTCCPFQSGQGVSNNTGTLTVRNSIIAGNGNGSTPDVTGNFTSQGHNLVGAATAGNNNGGSGDQSGFTHGVNGDLVGTIASPVNALLGPLTNNGGPTQTHALLAGSPALDAGDNTLAKDANNATLTTDQRGVARFAGAGLIVDIGAYEFHPSLEDVTNKTTSEDTPLSFSFNIGDTGNVTSVTAGSDNQTLVPDAGLVVSGSGPIRTLQVTPAANQTGTANITLTVNYVGGGTANDSFQLNVTPVNDAPSFTKGSDQTVAEDSGPQTVNGWATAISPGPNESAQTVSFLVTNNTNAALFASAPAVSASGTLTYTPAPNAFGSATLTLVAKDDGGTANGGQDASAPQTFTITVTAVNDPPAAQDQSVTTAEDSSRVITFTATDPENNPLTFSIVSNPSHGTLSGSGSSRTYTPAANYNGPDSFTYKATDSAGADSQAATVSITVTAVNDAPVNSVPPAQATDQNTTLVFSPANSNAVSVSDVDAGTDPLRVTLTTLNGTLTLGATAGLTFTAGDGSDDATMTFAGTLTDLNNALAGLAFKPTVGFSGATSLQLTTSDQGFNGAGGPRTDADFIAVTVRPGSIEFKQSAYTAAEGSGDLAVTVRRTGDTSQAASVAYATDDGSNPNVSVPCSATAGAALDRCDFTKALGRLTFAPGETEKTITVLLGDDSYVEGTETALIRLSGVTGSGVVLGSRAVATLEITDDAQESSSNPIDESGRFVRQHYHDFLNREPDAPGLAFWTNEIEGCGADAQCREVKRINVSAAFFLSIEFQQTGYLVYRLDKVAFGDISAARPVPLTLSEFLSDTQAIGQGLVVGAEGWEERLETNKRAFIDAFVLRTRFLSRYPGSTTPESFVDGLNANAGGALTQEERDSLVADLRGGVRTRAQVLRAVAEHPAVARRESNRAFVLMQYFGYLRRNPDDAPEANRDFAGYNFWLSKLNEFNGDYIRAEMVKAFLSAEEYRKRYGQ
ncbi:MAG: tandem-95 repeat protein [Pyrinomonadaceae bacterium]